MALLFTQLTVEIEFIPLSTQPSDSFLLSENWKIFSLKNTFNRNFVNFFFEANVCFHFYCVKNIHLSPSENISSRHIYIKKDSHFLI